MKDIINYNLFYLLLLIFDKILIMFLDSLIKIFVFISVLKHNFSLDNNLENIYCSDLMNENETYNSA